MLIEIFTKCTYLIFVFWLKYIFKVDIKIYQKKSLATGNKPLIIIANHISFWDPLIIISALPFKVFWSRRWRYPVAKTYFKTKWLGLLVKLLGGYPIYPCGELSLSLKTTFEHLLLEKSIIFFPQGKREHLSKISPPKKGISYIIKHHPINLLPIYISYPNSSFLPFGAKVTIGRILDSQKINNNINLDFHSEIIMNQIWNLKK